MWGPTGRARELAEALQSEACTLHTLHLSYNRVGADGARALAEALRSEACTLHTLNLEDNDVGEDGARALAEALRSEACTLHALSLVDNDVRAGGARALAEALETGPCRLQSIEGAPHASNVLRTRRRLRLSGLFRAVVALAVARKRATEVVFHPSRLKRRGFFNAALEEESQRVRTKKTCQQRRITMNVHTKDHNECHTQFNSN